MRERSAASHLGSIVLGEAIVYALLCLALTRFADVPAAWSVALWFASFLATRFVLVLLTFGFAWWTQRPWHLQPHVWLRMIIGEFRAVLRFERLILTDRWHRDCDTGSADASRPLLVLLHGIYCNRGIWRPVIRRLRQSLDCEIRAVSIGPCRADLAAQTRFVAQWLQQHVDPNRPVVIVGHSLGGLIARGAMRQCRDLRIEKLICIGTPHSGSRVARPLRGAIAKDLWASSAALTALAAEPVDTSRIVCVYTPHDNLIVPADSAVLPRTQHIEIDGVGHMALVYSPAVLNTIRATIDEAGTAK